MATIFHDRVCLPCAAERAKTDLTNAFVAWTIITGGQSVAIEFQHCYRQPLASAKVISPFRLLIHARKGYKPTRLEREFFFMAKRKKKRRAWTSTEVSSLRTMARKKTRASQIAKKLRRTEGATRQKAFSIGLSLDSRS